MSIFSRKPKGSKLIEPEYKTIVEEARERHRFGADAESEQRELELDDLRFCDPAQQWPDDIRAERNAEGRPCLVVDRLGPFVHQVVNEQRQSRPQPQVNPVGDGADKETAEVLQGMIRHIAYMSNGDTAIDTAFESMVRCGRGYFRVLTDYATAEGMEEDILIKRIPNVHSVILDPASTEPDGSDAEWGMITAYVAKGVYRSLYPGSKMATLDDSQWESIGDEAPEWAQRDGAGCMVVEYFKKERTSKKIEIDGQTRDAVSTQVRWYKLNAIEVLDETVWPGKYIPIVPVYGNELIQGGKRQFSGLIRAAKDAQRAYNYWKTAQAESIALAPKTPWVVAKGSIPAALRNVWQNANRRSVAVLEYEGYDAQQRPLPQPSRTAIEPPIMAITQAMVGAVEDLKGTTGMYDASMGNREANQSGVAIRALQQQGGTGNFHYADNLARSIRHLGRILIDLIPHVYDSERVIRIVKPDETTELATINGPSGVTDPKSGVERIYDVTTGTYDVTVSVGPSYQTKRQENLALMDSMSKGPLGQLITTVAPDLWVSMMDIAVAPQLVERLKKALPPQFQDAPEGQAGGNPQAMQQMLMQQKQQADMMAQQHEQLVATVHKLQDELDSQNAKLQADFQKAQLDAQTKLEIARMNNETELIKVQAQINAQKADEELNEQLAVLQQEHGELQELTLAMHSALSQPQSPQEEAAEPVQEAPTVEAAEPAAPDPMHKLMEGHTAALGAIAEALKRHGGAKKIVTDASGKPVGVAPVED